MIYRGDWEDSINLFDSDHVPEIDEVIIFENKYYIVAMIASQIKINGYNNLGTCTKVAILKEMT